MSGYKSSSAQRFSSLLKHSWWAQQRHSLLGLCCLSASQGRRWCTTSTIETLWEVNVIFWVFWKVLYIELLCLHDFNLKPTFEWISFGWIAFSGGLVWFRQKKRKARPWKIETHFLHTKVEMLPHFLWGLSDKVPQTLDRDQGHLGERRVCYIHSFIYSFIQ